MEEEQVLLQLSAFSIYLATEGKLTLTMAAPTASVAAPPKAPTILEANRLLNDVATAPQIEPTNSKEQETRKTGLLPK